MALRRAFVAFGANVGDRLGSIHQALALIEARGIAVGGTPVTTSFLYESKAKYVTNQPNFLNGSIMFHTSLNGPDLLKALKEIERDLGRTATFRNGPRTIDLDIIFLQHRATSEGTWQHDVVKTPDLSIPHISMKERPFVLAPMADIASGLIHPQEKLSCADLLQKVSSSTAPDDKLWRTLPLSNDQMLNLNERTFIMGVVNVTPDSFSDGGQYNSTIDVAVERIAELKSEGADIVDIGGQSTRPGAQYVSEEEELSRTLPVIKAARSAGITVPLSIDTFRASVARACVEAGANMVNDVTGGDADDTMVPTVAELGVPFLIMHMRGDAETMTKLKNYDSVVDDVCVELGAKVDRALSKGIRRWNLLVDPGLGFAKSRDQSLTLVRNTSTLKHRLGGFPYVVGASRKGFIGNVLGGRPAAERDWGTAAVCAHCAENGANLMRVHNVRAIRDVVTVSDAVSGRHTGTALSVEAKRFY